MDNSFWIWSVLFSALIKRTLSQTLHPLGDKELPLSLSLGYQVRPLFRDTTYDPRLSQEYLDLYQEMMKASQETLEKFDDEEQMKLMTIVGKEKLEIMKKGLKDRRRSANAKRFESPVGKRRVRSQATRRDKLNGQSLRSHQHHIQQAGAVREHRRSSQLLHFDTDDGRDYDEDGLKSTEAE